MYCTCTALNLDVEKSLSVVTSIICTCVHDVPGCAIEHRECHTGNGISIFHHCCKAMLEGREVGREGRREGGREGRREGNLHCHSVIHVQAGVGRTGNEPETNPVLASE